MKFWIFTGVFLTGFLCQSQTIRLFFPGFSGKEYAVHIYQGDRDVVLVRGVMDTSGEAIIKIPESYRPYRGILRWLLDEGGGIDMIVNADDFKVSCFSGHPTLSNIHYEQTEESPFLYDHYERQQQLKNRWMTTKTLLGQYYYGDRMHRILRKEEKRLERELGKVFARIAASPLYAARVLEISGFVHGDFNPSLVTMEDKAAAMRRFFLVQLDSRDLYTSGLWSQALFSWVQMYIQFLNDDTAFLADMKLFASRIKDNIVYTDFASTILEILDNQGKDYLKDAMLEEFLKHSGKIKDPSTKLMQQLLAKRVAVGSTAPDLYFIIPGSEKKESFQLTCPEGGHSLVIFYQSGCGHCDVLMDELIRKYNQLCSKGIEEVYAVSADTEPEVFLEAEVSFPWVHSYCDYKGFTGDNFTNYKILGTPSLFLLDHMGIIVKKGASLRDIVEYLDTK